MRQLDNLRKQGYFVKVSHWRVATKDEAEILANLKDTTYQRNLYQRLVMDKVGLRPSPRGGATTVVILKPNENFLNDKDGDVVAQGAAICNPIDNFNKKIGLQIALGRAVGQLFGLPASDNLPKIIVSGRERDA